MMPIPIRSTYHITGSITGHSKLLKLPTYKNELKLKRIIIILSMALLGSILQAKAQWVVTDPTNLVQNIISATQGTSTAANMINNVKESIKIYQQGKKYYDALQSVHNIVRDARKVAQTVALVSEITDIYVSGFGRIVKDTNFTPEELSAISASYAILLQESAALIAELRPILTGGNGLSMTDKERLDFIDKIYYRMLEFRNLTRYFTRKSISVSYLRSRERGNTERVLSLYGKPSERYW